MSARRSGRERRPPEYFKAGPASSEPDTSCYSHNDDTDENKKASVTFVEVAMNASMACGVPAAASRTVDPSMACGFPAPVSRTVDPSMACGVPAPPSPTVDPSMACGLPSNLQQPKQKLVGSLVKRNWNGKDYIGQAVFYDENEGWFHIIYDDEDEEDLDPKEVLAALITNEEAESRYLLQYQALLRLTHFGKEAKEETPPSSPETMTDGKRQKVDVYEVDSQSPHSSVLD